MPLIQAVLFVLVSVYLIIISYKPLKDKNTHGFYRFFVFEGVSAIVIINIPFWFRSPLSAMQIVSWIMLIISLFLVEQSFYFLHKIGGSAKRNSDSANFRFEDTVNLVQTGIYKYIRHPMYGSLLFLCIGALLKNVTLLTAILSLAVLVFLYLTAKTEEIENIIFFGDRYRVYMKKTKMFVPFLF